MAKKILENIAELKLRNEFANKEQLSLRLYSLELLLNDFGHSYIKDQEISRYIPIALVACIESFFRATYSEIIDYGEPYLGNINKLNKSKINIDYDMVNAIKDKKLTIGELVSYTISCNNISDIDNSLSKLLDIDFWYELKGFETDSIFEEVNLVNCKFRQDYERIKSSIARLFKLRHIFAHEFGTSVKVDKDTVNILFSDTKIFLENVREFIWFKLYPDMPETQSDMNNYEYKLLEQYDEILKEYVEKIMAQGSSGVLDFDKSLFKNSIIQWNAYRESEAKYKASAVEGGSMQPMVYASSMAKATKRKIKELEEDFPDLFQDI